MPWPGPAVLTGADRLTHHDWELPDCSLLRRPFGGAKPMRMAPAMLVARGRQWPKVRRERQVRVP